MRALTVNPYELPRTSRFALALISSVLTGVIATALLQWNTVKANVETPEQIPTRVADTDRDGLTDLEELSYRTSIYNADTDGDRMSDGEEVRVGRNPNGVGAENFLPLPMVNAPDGDHDGLADENENVIGTDPKQADSDGDGFPDGLEIENGYDPTGTGRPEVEVSIPAINVSAPLVWTASTDDTTIKEDLKKGIIHYPGTAPPGERGNAFITGHSSDYLWQRSPYRDIFKNLDKLKPGNEVFFTFTYANGKKRALTYRLTDKLIVAPTDRSILSPTLQPTLTLVTCYPVGSNDSRLAWRGVLTK